MQSLKMEKIVLMKLLRLKCNLTNEDVSKMMDVSLRTVVNWNNDYTTAPSEVVERLEKVNASISMCAFTLQRPIHYYDWKERYPELSQFNDDVQLAIIDRCIARTGIKVIRQYTPWTLAIDKLEMEPVQLVKMGYKDALDVYHHGAQPAPLTRQLLEVYYEV